MPKITIPRTNDFREVDSWRRIISDGAMQSSFFVYKSADQTGIASGVWTQITWDTEEYDTNNDFASSIFTPTIAGKYLFTAVLEFSSLGDNVNVLTGLYKNGSLVRRGVGISGGAATFAAALLCAEIEANGTGDYFEIYGIHYHGSARDARGGQPYFCSFAGHRIPFS